MPRRRRPAYRALPAEAAGSGRERHAALASRKPRRARYAVRRVENNEWRERRLTYATALHPSYGSRPHAQSDVEPGAQSTSRPSSRRAMKRSASRSRHMEDEDLFRQPRVAIRAPPRREDRRRRTEQPRPRRDPPALRSVRCDPGRRDSTGSPAVLHAAPDERCASRRDPRSALVDLGRGNPK